MGDLSQVSFEVLSKDKTKKECWSFYRLGMVLVVDDYRKMEKAPGKRGWWSSAHWSRLKSRNSTITREQVPLDDAVTATALREWMQLAETVSVGFQG